MRTSSPFLLVSLVLSAACASGTRQPYTAPSSETVHSEVETLRGGLGQRIFVVNLSSATIVVNALQLQGCENVQQSCEPTDPQVRVRPGERRAVFTVLPRTGGQEFSFRYWFGWARLR